MYSLLIVDDEASIRASYKMVFAEHYRLYLAENGEQALRLADAEAIDAVLLDLMMPGMSGLEVLEQLAAQHPQLPVVVVTATNTVDVAVRSMKLGAIDYLVKPFDLHHLRAVIANVLQRPARALTAEPGNTGFSELIGETASLDAALQKARNAADVDSMVLITGESGTGKDVLARAIHRAGARAEAPFVPLSCCAIPEQLVESELFGHVRGAYTGAMDDQPGKLQAADGGTLFLDEIGEMPLEAQAKLLRVLQDGVFYPVGGHRPVSVDVRFICATNRNLREMVAAGRFREDLYYRVNVFPIELPPLRRRREDIPLLAQHFLTKHRTRLRAQARRIAPEAIAALAAYDWPGNVRELENVVERVLVLHREAPVLVEAHFAGVLDPSPVQADAFEPFVGLPLAEATRRIERFLIGRALERSNGIQSHAANMLGTTRRILKYKMDQLDLREPDHPDSLAG